MGRRWFYISVGWVSLALGIIGIPLPLLPTTPFLLLSALCFARGSERLHDWLIHHERLGPPIQRWQEYRAISRDAKWMGTLSMVVVLMASFLFGAAPWILTVQAGVLIVVIAFLWTRPEPPSEA